MCTTFGIRGTLTLALWAAYGAAGMAQPFDQVLDTDQSSTVSLRKPGEQVLIADGVSIAPSAGAGLIGAPGDRWWITNQGDVAGDFAVHLQGESGLRNVRQIRGTHIGVLANQGLTLSNGVGAAISGLSAVMSHGPLVLDNQGLIEGTYDGLVISPTQLAQGAAVDNGGTLRGGRFGIVLRTAAFDPATHIIRNRTGALIESLGGNGVDLLHSLTTIHNEAGATVQGQHSALAGGDRYTFLNLDNAGSIRGGTGAGVWSYGGGRIVNQAGGEITGSGALAYVRSVASTDNSLLNAGTLRASANEFVAGNGRFAGSGAGVYFGGVEPTAGGRVDNLASGSILGSVYGLYSGAAVAATDAGPITVNNAGLITGRTGIALNGGDGSISNRGTIRGTAGDAIVFDAAAERRNRLTLDSGSRLEGQVRGGAGFDALLLLGSGAEDLSRFVAMDQLTLRGDDWTLGGTGGFAASRVERGVLRLDGQLTSDVRVDTPGTLAGGGTLHGNALIDGTLAPSGTLTIDGNLSLSESALLDYRLGQANRAGGPLNDLTLVRGDLVLDGTLKVRSSPGGAFGPGVYRLFEYGGRLLDNGLTLGAVPGGSQDQISTGIAGQVNLLHRAEQALSWWDGGGQPFDGRISGGTGIWQAGTDLNWSEASGALNGRYDPGSFAIFAGQPGQVTLSHAQGPVLSAGMQFASDGYRLQGEALTLLAGQHSLRVGDGTARGATFSATITAPLSGLGGLDKSDLGTLVLAGDNPYSGATTVSGGTLRAGADQVFAHSSAIQVQAGATLDLGGYRQTAQRLAGAGMLLLGDAELTVHNASSRDDSRFSGVLQGSGGLRKSGDGTLTLDGATRYRGGTHLQGGQLLLDGGNGGAQLQSQVTGEATAQLSLRNGASLRGQINGPNLAVDALSSWTLTADSRLDRLQHAGQIGFAEPGLPMLSGRTLRVRELTGQGGVVALYSVLGGSGAVSDRLLIDGGSATGSTSLLISNAGGLGDQTLGNGLPVVLAVNGASTTANAFSLAQPVLAGPYQYRLQRGGADAPDDWFLRSSTDTGPANYRAETTLYSAAPGQALRDQQTLLGSLHQRRGARADLALDPQPNHWLRTISQRDWFAANGQRSTLSAAQFGLDLLAITQGSHTARLAGYAAYGTSHGVAAHTDPQQRRAPAGGNRLTAYSLGLTGTLSNGQGGYLDAVLQGSHYQLASRSRAGMRLNTRGYGLAASLETGQRFALAEHWDWQPQAQLIHQRLALGQGADDAGRVRFAPSQSTQLRLGGRLNHSLRARSAAPATAWLGLHVQRQLGSPGATDFATPTQGAVRFFGERPRGTWRAEVGVEGHVHPNLLLNGRLAAEQSLGGQVGGAFQGKWG